MLDNLQDLARLEAAEAFLKEIEFSDIWIVVERDFEDAKAEILKPYLTKSVSKLFQ